MKYCIDHLIKALAFAKLYDDEELIALIESAIETALNETKIAVNE